LVEQDNLDPAGAEMAHKDIVLVEKNYRLKSGSIEVRSQIEQRLMRATDGAVFVTLNDQDTRRVLIAINLR
jgi:hypothetical protein